MLPETVISAIVYFFAFVNTLFCAKMLKLFINSTINKIRVMYVFNSLILLCKGDGSHDRDTPRSAVRNVDITSRSNIIAARTSGETMVGEAAQCGVLAISRNIRRSILRNDTNNS